MSYVKILGKLWMPSTTASTEITLSKYDLENIGEFTRENVDDWLGIHAGDFSQVIDFRAVSGETVIDWENPESEFDYLDTLGYEY